MAADIAPRWSADTEELVAEVLLAASASPARTALTALADAGLLVPPGAEVESQWRVKWRDIETNELMATSVVSDRREADRRLEDLDEVWGHHARLVERSVISTPWTIVPGYGFSSVAPVAPPERMLPDVLAERISRPDEAPAMPLRCPSCEHLDEFHQPEGCWFAVGRGTVGANLVCPCTVARPEVRPPTAGPAVQLQELMRVGAVRVVEQIRLVHVRGDDEYCHWCHALWPCPTIAIVESVEPWATLARDGRQAAQP